MKLKPGEICKFCGERMKEFVYHFCFGNAAVIKIDPKVEDKK